MHLAHWYILADSFAKLTNVVEAPDVRNATGARGVWDDENIIRLGPVVILDELLGERYFAVDVDVIRIVLYTSFGLRRVEGNAVVRQSSSRRENSSLNALAQKSRRAHAHQHIRGREHERSGDVHHDSGLENHLTNRYWICQVARNESGFVLRRISRRHICPTLA